MARPRKIQQDALLEIIRKYTEDNPYTSTLKYSALVKYAKTKLGYEDISYQDFSRNKTIKEFVEIHNARSNMTSYMKNWSDDKNRKLEKFSFNVDTVVDRYMNNKKQLKAVLKVFKDIYDKSFESLAEYAKKDAEKAKIINEQKEKIEELEKKNTELIHEIKSKKESKSSDYRTEKLKYMYLTVQDMISNNRYHIENESEIIDILKNFGYSANDIVDVKEILKKEFDTEELDLIASTEESMYEEVENVETTPKEKVTSIKGKKLKQLNFMK